MHTYILRTHSDVARVLNNIYFTDYFKNEKNCLLQLLTANPYQNFATIDPFFT